MPIAEARNNDEVISLADSQVLRWIDEINGVTDADSRARELKSEIKRLRKEPNNIQNRRAIRRLYEQLDELQFKPDYMCLIIEKEKDYYRACNGFSINGIKYKRLLGTNGGIKNSTIVFVSESVVDELRRRIENGRNPNIPLVTAKLEAYKALTCSASIPVSMPNGILIVDDVETTFTDNVVYLSDENDGEPEMRECKGEVITMDASDGYGLMCPALAERWSKELGLDYVMAGANSRMSWEKGMIFTFDFHDFADKVAGERYIVKDAWGNEVDIRQIEVILTTSMVKLWDSYDSCEEYIQNSIENGYTFGIAKTCPKKLENERNLNYQFIQSYDLNDDDIEELIAPTMNEIKDILQNDWRKTVLYLKGGELSVDKVDSLADDIAKAIMIDHGMLDDPYVQNTIYQLIQNRIKEAKVGVLKVHGNYSIVSGDPYALCQSIFGLEVTGLLKAGEIYNRYWIDNGSDKVVCFRAPMTCHNNILSMHPANRDDVNYWYKYMNTCTIFNAWDTATAALNGCDFDGDLVMTTDNDVLVRKHRKTDTLMCMQRRAEKRISTEEDFIRSNIDSFGNDIGQTTNWITSMFEVQSHFTKGSREYEMLDYRIKCGQHYQQNAIDKAKGIICKPMPRSWHDRFAANKIEDETTRNLYRAIEADKKPYFMKYIYPALSKQYNTFIKNTTENCLCNFGMTVEELKMLPYAELTDAQKEFLKWYDYRMPVGIGDCVMNKICRRFEEEFDSHIKRHNAEVDFDYSIIRGESEYTTTQFSSIRKLHDKYNRRLRDYIISADMERVDSYDKQAQISIMNNEFRRACDSVCSCEETLCSILIDICYAKSSTKRFVWNLCSSQIIRNLLERNKNIINIPVKDDDGDIKFGGVNYSVKEVCVNEVNG